MPTVQLEFRIARNEDVQQIVDLNFQWRSAFEQGSLEKGFLRHSLTPDHVQRLIGTRQIVVAEDVGRIAGYYLTDPDYNHSGILERIEIIKQLVATHKLPNVHYSYFTQAAIHPDYLNKGIARRLLTVLKDAVVDRVDVLVGVIYKGNESGREAAIRTGWELIADMSDGFLAINPTSS